MGTPESLPRTDFRRFEVIAGFPAMIDDVQAAPLITLRRCVQKCDFRHTFVTFLVIYGQKSD